jgi:hypothetical protein
VLDRDKAYFYLEFTVYRVPPQRPVPKSHVVNYMLIRKQNGSAILKMLKSKPGNVFTAMRQCWRPAMRSEFLVSLMSSRCSLIRAQRRRRYGSYAKSPS